MALECSEAVAASNRAGRRRRHVLLFPLAYQGHINPMFRLADVLHARGFAVTVFHTHFNAPDPARHPEYRFVPVPDGVSGPAPVAMEDVVSNIFALNAACEAPFRGRLATILDEYSEDGGVACFIADSHLLSMVQVATRLAVPVVVLRTGSAASFSCFRACPMLMDRVYLPVRESELETEVSELPPYRVGDLMRVGSHDLTRELLARVVTAVDVSAGLILNMFDALERRELEKLRRDLTLPVFDIGPLHMFCAAAESSHAGCKRPRTQQMTTTLTLYDPSAADQQPDDAGALVPFGPSREPIDAVPLSAVAPKKLAPDVVRAEPPWLRTWLLPHLTFRMDLPVHFIAEKTVTATDLVPHHNRFRLPSEGVMRNLWPMLSALERTAANMLHAAPRKLPKLLKAPAEKDKAKKQQGRNHGGLPVLVVEPNSGITELQLTRWDSGGTVIKGEGYLNFIRHCGFKVDDVVEIWAFKESYFRLFGVDVCQESSLYLSITKKEQMMPR